MYKDKLEAEQEQQNNPMNVDANIIFDDYQKQVSELEWDSKVKKAQLKNYQKLVNDLQQENKDLKAQLASLTKKDEKLPKNKK